MTPEQRQAMDLRNDGLSWSEVGKIMGISDEAARAHAKRAKKNHATEALSTSGYDLTNIERTPEDAWNDHAGAFERKVSKIMGNQWQSIKQPKGPVVVFHTTDEHVDDDGTPLRLIEDDIRWANDFGAVKVHGGDVSNNWPLNGRLAKQWAEQTCTLPDSLLRVQHFINLLDPDVWTPGNHCEFNGPHFDALINEWLPKKCIKDYWTTNFQIETPGGRPLKLSLSHKFAKGSSWFHPHHGFIREMLEGQEADVYLEGHLHISGWMYKTMPERGISALGVCSAGYKVVDKYAARISRGGKIPKLKGRVHWLVGDTECESGCPFMPFDDPRQAEAYLNGLQNLRSV